MEHPTKKLKRSESNGRRHLGSHSSSSSSSSQRASRSQQQQPQSASDSKSSITHQRYSLRTKRKPTTATSTTKKSSNTADTFAESSTSQQQPSNSNNAAAAAASSTIGSKKRSQKRKQTTTESSSTPRKRQRAPSTRTRRNNNNSNNSKMENDHAEELKRSTTTTTTATTTRQRANSRGPSTRQAAKSSEASSKRKGKGKAPDQEHSKSTSTTTRRRAKKQADPEELESHEPESDLDTTTTPVSYFQYFDDDDMEDDREHTFDDEDEYEHGDSYQDDHPRHDDAQAMHEDLDDEEEDEEDDDDEDDDDTDELERIRRSFGLQLSSSFGGMMSDMSSRLRSILASLKNDEPTMQLVALQELAEILSVSSEENLAGYFASDSFVKELVRIMKGPTDLLGGGLGGGGDMDDDMMMALAMSEGLGGGNPEIALLACRCISNLLDAMPTAVTSVVYHGAVGVLCQKLKSIEYIDLAEQALCALEKVAQHLPRAVVHEGGLSAALMYFDFFSIHSQRTALRTAANCMRGVDADSFPQVMEVVPTLLNTISYPDRTVIELTCLCWVKFAETYRNNSELLEKAITKELLEKMTTLIPVPGNTNVVRPSTFTDLLRIFRVISRGSPKLGYDLIELKIVDTLYRVLVGAAKAPEDTVPTDVSLDSKWRDSVHSILRIFVDVLPSLPKDGMFSSRRFKETSSRGEGTEETSSTTTTTKDKGNNNKQVDPRVELLEKNADVVKRLDQLCIPVLLEVYMSTVTLRTRQLVTHNLVKLIHFSNADTLQQILKDLPLSSFLAGILAQQEHSSLVIDALFQVELLLKKLPEVYRFLFEREGVLHEVEMLANAPMQDESQAEENADNKNKQGEGDSSEPSKDSDEPASALDVLRSMQESIREAQAAVDEQESSDEEGEEEEEEDNNDDEDGNNNIKASTSSSQADKNEAVPSSDKKRKSSSRRRQPQQQEDDKSSSQTESTPPRRRLFDRSGLHALLRSRFGAPQVPTPESEKGIGRGSTRRYIIRLAQNILSEYQAQDQEGVSKSSSTLQEIKDCAQSLKGTSTDPEARHTLEKLMGYLQGFKMGISSFELMNSGLMETLLAYLTDDKDSSFHAQLDTRRQTFIDMFLKREATMEADEIYPVRVLVMRLQEVLSRSEPFEVVTPLESSSLGDNFRNPTSMLAKQLRLRLSGRGSDIPVEYQQLMVSTHAVATFKVLEEYLLARIGSMSSSSSAADASSRRRRRRRGGLEEDEDLEDDDDEENSEIEEIDVDNMDEEEEEENHHEEDAMEQEQQPEEEKAETSKGKKTSSSSTENKPGKWTIRFYLNDTLISNDTTVYGAVHQYEINNNNNTRASSSMRNIWITSYPVTFERVYVTKDDEEKEQQASTTTSRTKEGCERPSVLTDESVCTRALQLLRVLMDLARPLTYCTLPLQDFVNRKVAAKMNRQLEEPLIVASSCLPRWTYWLMLKVPFLFPFETRYLFIQSTSFGYSRLIARWQSMQMRNNQQRDDHHHSQQPVLGRMERQKVRIMRSQMLESAIKILDLFGSSQSVLEIEYNGEEGTGLGPTLEFYAATSREFCKKSLNMWRDDDTNAEEEYVIAKHGLFPKPLAKSGSTKIINLFKTLGQFMAKAMLDFRIIDLPFSAAFFKVAIGHEQPSMSLVAEIDPVLGQSIQRLQAYVDQKRAIYADKSKTNQEKLDAASKIQVDGCSIEDLCLDFTLPGEANLELKAGGADIPVTINNVEEYIDLLQDKLAGSGIAKQMDAFRQGFDQLFALDDLKILTYNELVSLYGVSSEDWSYATLADAIKADHGFSMESVSFKNLLTILSEMNDDERREFLQFTTGSPRLPIGGWKAMRPVFTVVCKTAESPLSPDDYLPSVMTCANYLKMPDYSSKEKMRTRLLTSMREGKNSFLLS